MKRIAIAFFYDADGVVDDYFFVLLAAMDRFCDKIIVVANGEIGASYANRLSGMRIDLTIRENVGFDVGAYKQCLDALGPRTIATYDEIVLMNHTFFGPIFPFTEMFDLMDARPCDFWGITSHKGVATSSYGPLPPHLNSHFIAIRKRLATSREFQDYWAEMPPIESYKASILSHEARFTGIFEKLGYHSSVYIDPDDYGSDYPLFEQLDDVLMARCPIVKRRSLFMDPVMADQMAVDTPLVLELIKTHSNYDVDLIWQNIIRTTPLRILYTNTALLRVFPDHAPVDRSAFQHLKICVCLHVFYPELMAELLAYCRSIPLAFDVIATTDTLAKKVFIEQALAAETNVRQVTIDIVKENVGADVAPLLITSAPRIYAGDYDVVCRLHTKKSPKDPARRATYFKDYLLKNLVGTESVVSGILATFASDPKIGVMMPPTIHVSFPVMGNGWFTNKDMAQSVADRIGARVILHDETPIAPYGSMFWFRPKALRKLLTYSWQWQDFHHDGPYHDGDLPHAIERLHAYVAQDAGFLTIAAMSASQVERSYVRLEYKVQKYASLVPSGDFAYNCHELTRWKATRHHLVWSETEVLTDTSAPSGDQADRDPKVEVTCKELLKHLPARGTFDAILHPSRNRINFNIDTMNGRALGDSKAVVVRGQDEPLLVEGWTFAEGSKIPFAAIVVWLTNGASGVSGRAKSVSRPDLGSHFGVVDLVGSGFRCALSIKDLALGEYHLTIFGIDRRGGFRRASHVVSVSLQTSTLKRDVEAKILDASRIYP